jgi:hypothetical protein
MSKTASLETSTELTAKEKDKEPKVKKKDEAPDPYCCTPPDGDGGPDQKP